MQREYEAGAAKLDDTRLLSDDLALMAQKMAIHLGGAPYVTVSAGDFQWWLDFMGRATAAARRLEIRAGLALDPAHAVSVRLPEPVRRIA